MYTPSRWLGMVALAAAAVVLATGCGSSGPSKPSYCAQVSKLKQSLKDLPNVNVVQGGTSALKAAVDKVQSNAQAVVSAARTDFPTEASAIRTSITSLKQSAQQLAGRPSAAQLAAVAGAASASVKAVQSFTRAVSSKCG